MSEDWIMIEMTRRQSKMILHVFNKQEKFSIQLFRFFKDYNFNMAGQFVFHYGKSSGYFEREKIDCLYTSFINPIKHIKLYHLMNKSDMVIVHSLASPFLLFLLALKLPVTKKIYWIIWGKDLYFSKCVNMNNPVNILYESLRKKALRNVKHIITGIKGDYELACEWYGINAEYITVEGNGYPYNCQGEKSEIVYKDSLQKVLLGNSASLSNNHLQALKQLKKVDNGKMEIVTPLSYGGSSKYVQQVVSKGKELFGERFLPLTEFMKIEKYNEILNGVDIAFFYHDRQEAFNNTLSLLGAGKKVFMRPKSTLWQYFNEKGIKVHNSEILGTDFWVPDAREVISSNVEKTSAIRDIQLAVNFWKDLFNICV